MPVPTALFFDVEELAASADGGSNSRQPCLMISCGFRSSFEKMADGRYLILSCWFEQCARGMLPAHLAQGVHLDVGLPGRVALREMCVCFSCVARLIVFMVQQHLRPLTCIT